MKGKLKLTAEESKRLPVALDATGVKVVNTRKVGGVTTTEINVGNIAQAVEFGGLLKTVTDDEIKEFNELKAAEAKAESEKPAAGEGTKKLKKTA
jgi:mannose/fructose/N-acetylgalactosamine-specific phosphotransferase system component IIB